MPIDILVDKWEVKATDVIHINAFYIALHDYLWREEYSKGKDGKFPETYYWETRTQKGGREMWVWWRPKKGVRGSSFYERVLVVDLHGVGVNDVEVMRHGKKWKVQKGKVEVLVKAKLRLDPNDEWKNHWFLSMVLELFWKRIYKKHIDMHKQELLKDSYKFNEAVKRLMELNTFTISQKPFAPAKAFGDPFTY
ncbi:MAG: hypothetical protein ABIG89_05465 [Candidatus Woesearchaeota archaeon]